MNSFFWCFVLVLTGSHIAQSGFELATLGGLKQAVSMTDFKVAVQETRPRSLSPRTGQIQTSQLRGGGGTQASGNQSETAWPSAAALPPGLRQGQWVSHSFQASPATVSRLLIPQQWFWKALRYRTNQLRKRSPISPGDFLNVL
jgi:hypothetical protein